MIYLGCILLGFILGILTWIEVTESGNKRSLRESFMKSGGVKPMPPDDTVPPPPPPPQGRRKT